MLRKMLCLGLLFLCASAHADTLEATRDQPLVETAHVVDVSLSEGLVTYRVQRTFHNRGKLAEEAQLTIDLPPGAVATGLRIKAKDRWYAGELMPADQAEAMYRELTGLGPSEPKDPALLYWRWQSELGLRVFPVFPGQQSTVEYTLTVPTEYDDGAYHVYYPRRGESTKLATPVVRLGELSGYQVQIDGEASQHGAVLTPPTVPPIVAELGLSEETVLVQSMKVPTEGVADGSVTLRVDIEHTWAGDIELRLFDPVGEEHEVLSHDFSNQDNALKQSFEIEYAGKLAGTWHLVVRDHHPLDSGVLKGWSLGGKTKGKSDWRATHHKPAVIPQPTADSKGMATLVLAPKREIATQLRLGRVAVVPAHQFSRAEIDVARRLSQTPTRLSVAFAIDLSHTMGQGGVEAQLQLVRAYLKHVPDARFALIGYGRHPEDLGRGFHDAGSFERVVAGLQGKLETRNGSFLDRGVERGIASLRAESQAGRATMLVLFTDNRLRPRWNNAPSLTALAGLHSETTVHVVDMQAGHTLAISRDDQHRLFPLAKRNRSAEDHCSALAGVG